MNMIPLQRGLSSWRPVKSHALERYYGSEIVENLSHNMRQFYWPIPIVGSAGIIYAMPGGDFVGDILTNGEMSVNDRMEEYFKRERNAHRARLAHYATRHDLALRGRFERRAYAFASDDAVLAAETGGKAQTFANMVKVGVASNAIGNAVDLWTALTSNPVAGAAAGAAPGGTVPTSASTGAIPYVNPSNAGTGHFRSAEIQASVVNMTLLLHDRLFAVAKTMNSTGNEAVTGVPTRYTNQTSTGVDYIGGSFCFPSIPTTVLPATAHNWTAGGGAGVGCTYTNQGGSAANFPVATGVSACVLRGIDLAANAPGWFLPLAAGDVGVKALTNMACSALVATGTVDFVVAHPIAFIPCYAANVIWTRDALYGPGPRMPHVEDNACLSLLEMPKSAVTATTYQGSLTFVGE